MTLVLAFGSSSPILDCPANLVLFIRTPSLIVLVLLFCAADKPFAHHSGYQQIGQTQRRVTPEKYASTISPLTFWYASEMVWKGLSGSISFEQLWAVDSK